MEKQIVITVTEEGYGVESNFDTPDAIVFWLEKAKLKVFEDTFTD